MSYLSRSRKQRIRGFKSRLKWNDGADRAIGNWLLVDVHQIPPKINYGQGFDFWCSNGKDVYLLTIQKEKLSKLVIRKTRFSSMNLAVFLDFEVLTNEIIENVIGEFERIGIPRYKFGSI